MMGITRVAACLAAIIAVCGPALAQETQSRDTASAPETADPFAVADPAAVAVPNMAFAETPKIRSKYDQFFYFHRTETSFAEAYADIRECDRLARRPLERSNKWPDPVTVYGPNQYTLGGVVGGALGNLLVGELAIAARTRAERKRLRRVNMRLCMAYKGYQRFGTSEPIWREIDFEGDRNPSLARRHALFARQAVLASGPRPLSEALEP